MDRQAPPVDKTRLPFTQSLLDNLAPESSPTKSAGSRMSRLASMEGSGRKSSFDSAENVSQMNRPAIMRPEAGSKHKDYNRLKYYSKLRTSILSSE